MARSSRWGEARSSRSCSAARSRSRRSTGTLARSGRGDGRAQSPRLQQGPLVSVLGFGAVGRLRGWNVEVATLWAYQAVLGAIALGLLGDTLRGRWSQGAVTGLVVDLGALREPATLRDRLARALGDSSLELGWSLGSDRGVVDEAGRPSPFLGRVPTVRSRRSRARVARSPCWCTTERCSTILRSSKRLRRRRGSPLGTFA